MRNYWTIDHPPTVKISTLCRFGSGNKIVRGKIYGREREYVDDRQRENEKTLEGSEHV